MFRTTWQLVKRNDYQWLLRYLKFHELLPSCNLWLSFHEEIPITERIPIEKSQLASVEVL